MAVLEKSSSYAHTSGIRHSIQHSRTRGDGRSLACPSFACPDLREPDELSLDPALEIDGYLDSYGNRCSRFLAPMGLQDH